MPRGAAWIRCSSSDCGAVSNTRRYTPFDYPALSSSARIRAGRSLKTGKTGANSKQTRTARQYHLPKARKTSRCRRNKSETKPGFIGKRWTLIGSTNFPSPIRRRRVNGIPIPAGSGSTVRLEVLGKRREGLFADVVLHAFGIRMGDRSGNSQGAEEISNQIMTVP